MSERDQELYPRLRRRDPDALEELIRCHARRLLNLIQQILGGLGTCEDAEEVLSDTFVKVWNDIEQYDPERASLTTWLYMRAKYTALDRRRKLGRRLQTTPLVDGYHVPWERGRAMDLAERWDLREILSTLPDLERELIYRRYFLQESLEEIADEVDYSVHAVRNRLWRTRRRLADEIRPLLVETESAPGLLGAAV
ncbi:MAG: sigma-70 family RNA polymerase sigma factor [Chloroflexia bacterium]|nr:sigma-70 family RNA polymerase sigma factor [Chloroflexia bacterium]